jgi:hypothetical protein
MAKLKEGNSLAQLSAREFNRHVEAADAWHRSQALGPRRFSIAEGSIPTDVVKVKLAATLPRGSVIELGDRLVDELDPHYLWYDWVPSGPNPEHFWAITRQQITEDTIGEAQVAGVCIARVDVLDMEHRFARVVQGENVLQSAGSGPCRLVQLAEEEGEQELVVQIRYEPRVEIVVPTSDEKEGDFYPGKLLHYEPATDTFTEVADIWIRNANEA